MPKQIVKKQQQIEELYSLEKPNGLLSPIDVVQFAKNPKTALHSAFEWNNSKAAHEHRLWQARQLIVSVKMLPRKNQEPIQVFVSMQSDRTKSGGYRRTVKVLSSKKLRSLLLQQAWNDFQYWKEKYDRLVELAPLFDAAENLQKKLAKSK